MKNVILTLLVYLSYVVMVNASTAINIRKRRHFVEKSD